MDRSLWLKRVNIILFFSFIYQGLTGLGAGLFNAETFGVIHPVGGVVLVFFGLLHVGLNWGWVKSVLLRKHGMPGGKQSG
jgi:hypothetical protein